MRVFLCVMCVLGSIPTAATAVETKVEANLSGSMSRLRLYNQTIFPQRTVVSVDGHAVDEFELEAHEKLDVFVECHGTVQRDVLPVSVASDGHEWRGNVSTGQAVKRSIVLWISLQRQGRARIERLLKTVKPTAKVTHLSLSEAPTALAQYDQVSMVLMSAADLERLDKPRFQALQSAVSLGMTLVVSARESSVGERSRLKALTASRFSKWSALSEALAKVVPSATRLASVTIGNDAVARYRLESEVVVGDSPFGFGYVRLLGLPFSALTKGEVTKSVFREATSRERQPMRWLESRISDNLSTFFISPLIPLSGLLLVIGIYLSRRSVILSVVCALVWWGGMIAVPVTSDGLALVKEWGVWSTPARGQAILSRLDIDHRVGRHEMLNWRNVGVDLKMLRSGAVCLFHRGNETRLVFPPTAERMTRLFIGRTTESMPKRNATETTYTVPKWPEGPYSGVNLLPVEPPEELPECVGGSCAIYQLNENAAASN